MTSHSTAIVGIGESRVGRLRGMSALHMTLEASKAALHDAGLPTQVIDGVLTRNLDMDVTYNLLLRTSSSIKTTIHYFVILYILKVRLR